MHAIGDGIVTSELAQLAIVVALISGGVFVTLATLFELPGSTLSPVQAVREMSRIVPRPQTPPAVLEMEDREARVVDARAECRCVGTLHEVPQHRPDHDAVRHERHGPPPMPFAELLEERDHTIPNLHRTLATGDRQVRHGNRALDEVGRISRLRLLDEEPLEGSGVTLAQSMIGDRFQAARLGDDRRRRQRSSEVARVEDVDAHAGKTRSDGG